MVIRSAEIGRLSIPLTEPFVTSLRRVDVLEALVLRIATDDGLVGFGAASPTAVITGDTLPGIEATVALVLSRLRGVDLWRRERWEWMIRTAAVHNGSGKAAVEMALYDVLAQAVRKPLFVFLGGAEDELTSDLTLNMGSPEAMARSAETALRAGYPHLKVKVGSDPETDIARVLHVREVLPDGVSLRIDANQGWTAKQAIAVIDRLADADVPIELVEQPVPADDIRGMVRVTQRTAVPILADESVYSLPEAVRLIREGGCDAINIKLMKSGGIGETVAIARVAERFGVSCMMGSMMECRVGVDAAAHVAAAVRNITMVDLDTPTMYEDEPVRGSVRYSGARILLGEAPGLGVTAVDGVVWRPLEL